MSEGRSLFLGPSQASLRMPLLLFDRPPRAAVLIRVLPSVPRVQDDHPAEMRKKTRRENQPPPARVRGKLFSIPLRPAPRSSSLPSIIDMAKLSPDGRR